MENKKLLCKSIISSLIRNEFSEDGIIDSGSIGNTDIRKTLFNKAVTSGFKMINIIDESASVDKTFLLEMVYSLEKMQ